MLLRKRPCSNPLSNCPQYHRPRHDDSPYHKLDAGEGASLATQEQAYMVARQFQIISQSERSSQAHVASDSDTAREVAEIIEAEGSSARMQSICRDKYRIAKIDSIG
jgi:hypothetical protein